MNFKKYLSKIIYVVVPVLVIVLLAILKYKSGEIDYINSDATWHVLLTVSAYDETPKSIHKFIPLVSLGKAEDKNISWGATVPDENGNYYYTSFSPAGFVLPYIFIKIFNLPIAEKSLYIFNTILFSISAIFWVLLIEKLFKENSNKNIIIFIGMITYIFVPELCHGMGIVYWHHSILQVTLCMQLYFYYRYKYENSKKSYIVFLLLCLINPYIEWTGYVANFGFAFAEFVSNWKESKKKSLKKAIVIGIFTVLSFIVFSIHYLLVISPSSFLNALKARFFARNFATSNVILTDVFGGYFTSFLYLWVLLFIVIVYLIVVKGKIEFHNKLMMLVMLFPIIENIVMKEHAFIYTYDRMKLIFILSYLICDLISQAIEKVDTKKLSIIFVIITILFGILNIDSYINNKNYKFFNAINYRKSNQEFVDYINNHYSDNVIVSNTAVRGYMNLLFHRGIYENHLLDSAQYLAEIQNKRYAIELDFIYGNIPELINFKVYDMITGELKIVEKTENGFEERDNIEN